MGSPSRQPPARAGATAATGVDETSFLAVTATERTQWVSIICDVEIRFVIDLIEDRGAPDLDRWCTKHGAENHRVESQRAPPGNPHAPSTST